MFSRCLNPDMLTFYKYKEDFLLKDNWAWATAVLKRLKHETLENPLSLKPILILFYQKYYASWHKIHTCKM